MKISKVICPNCNQGEFNSDDRKCNVCGQPLTDEIVQAELDKAWEEHVRKERRAIVIENPDNGERFLLPFTRFREIGIPHGFWKRTSTIPLPEECWDTVKDLPIYKD